MNILADKLNAVVDAGLINAINAPWFWTHALISSVCFLIVVGLFCSFLYARKHTNLKSSTFLTGSFVINSTMLFTLSEHNMLASMYLIAPASFKVLSVFAGFSPLFIFSLEYPFAYVGYSH